MPKKKSERRSIKKVANKLVEDLGALGFTIQRYDAYGTSSVYLKLDFGVSHSIRISDHKGHGHLKYRYNVRTDRDASPAMHMDEFERYYYGADNTQLAMMIDTIVSLRSARLLGYGVEEYKKMMHERRYSNEGRRGFWSQSHLVREGEPRMMEHEEINKLNEGVLQW